MFFRVILLSAFFIFPHLLKAEEVVVDEISFEGITVFSAEEIENLNVIEVGAPLNQFRLDQTIQNLKSAFELRGYYNSEISYKNDKKSKNKIIVKFVVQENLPTRISLFDFSLKENDENINWDKLKQNLLDEFTFKGGEILDEQVIQNYKIQIETFLRNQDYIAAKVSQVYLEKIDKNKIDQSQNAKNNLADTWVKINFNIELGDKITFGFIGNERLSVFDLEQIIEQQRKIGFSKDYIVQIQNKILEKYSSLAYVNSKIKVYTFENFKSGKKHVRYQIEEGSRVKVSQLFFEGNFVFSNEKLNEIFYDNAPFLLSRGYYVSDELDDAIKHLMEFLKSQGYLSSKVLLTTKKFSDDKSKVDIFVYLYEGEQTFVKNIEIIGNTRFNKEEISGWLGVVSDEPLNLFRFTEGIEKLKTEYRRAAYLEVEIQDEDGDQIIQYDSKARFADIHLKINEGPEFRVGDIDINGLSETKEYVVLRELQFSQGDLLSESRLVDTENRLRRLGIFSSVSIKLRNSLDFKDTKDVRIILKEAIPGNLRTGAGFRNDLGLRVFSEISYSNLWGKNHTWFLSGDTNRRLEEFKFLEYQFQLGYRWPWFFFNELNFSPVLSQKKRKYFNFNADTTALALKFDRKLLKYVDLVGIFSYNLEIVRQFGAKDTNDNNVLRIGSLVPALRLDLRDDPLAPTKGFYSYTSFEYAASRFGSQRIPFPIEYTRFQFRADQFIPLLAKVNLFLSFRTGIARNLVKPEEAVSAEAGTRVGIPLIKQFALGGPGSLRGFRYQELNVQDFNIYGLLSFVNYRTQIDLPLAGAMRFGPFLDAGNLNIDRYSFGGLRYGVGFGLHYQTPVGPINFDWGFKIEPQKNEDPSRFHFSVGVL